MTTPREAVDPLLRAGQLSEARAALEKLLGAGGAAEDHALLGLLCGMLGDAPGSEAACRKAIAIKPAYPEAWANLGIALAAQDRTGEALTAYGRALVLNPANAAAHNNRATALNRLGRRREAEAEYRRAIDLKADYPDAWHNLANLLAADARRDEALECHRRALSLNPKHLGALNSLGQHYLARGETGPALDFFNRALAVAPRHAGTLNNLGNALLGQDDVRGALEHLRRAAALSPADAAIWNNLGLAQLAAGDPAEARRCYEEALRVKPDSPEGWINLGNLHERDDRHGEAERCYRTAIALRPDSAEAHNNLGIALHAQGRLDEALASYREAVRIRSDYPDAWTNLLFALNFNPAVSPPAICAAHREWGGRFGTTRSDLGAPIARGGFPRRLRIGYVTPDLRAHSVAAFMEPVLKAHDRARFELFCYVEIPAAHEDETSARLKALGLVWRNTWRLGDPELARRMREDGIDILVDLAGHTANTRLRAFAFRPAPVQVTWLGYANTTDLPAMQYRLTDARADPPGQEAVHSEELIRLPEGFLCFGPPANAPEVNALPCAGAGPVTFGSFNMLPKTTPAVVALWARILQAVPGSRLLLKNRSMGDPATRARYEELFATHGIPRSRLEFIGWLAKRDDHLGLYGRIDIALDTFPYNGTTTTCEALWMGVPVMALEGNRHAARVGVSILSNLDLTELIAKDEEDYIEKAKALAADPERLKTLRTTMRDRMERSTLCDPARFTRELEQVYLGLWERAVAEGGGGSGTGSGQ